MATQTTLNFERLPYGQEAALLSNIFITVPGKILAAVGKMFDTLSDAIAMRDRYVELNGLDEAQLTRLGIKRQNIPQVVAVEAGLLETVTTPVAHNSNERDVRPAA